MTYKVYQLVRRSLAAVLAIIGVVAIWLFASQGSSGNTFSKVAMIFWTVVPPAWFLFEYWIFDSEKLIKRPFDGSTNQPVAKEKFLRASKTTPITPAKFGVPFLSFSRSCLARI